MIKILNFYAYIIILIVKDLFKFSLINMWEFNVKGLTGE